MGEHMGYTWAYHIPQNGSLYLDRDDQPELIAHQFLDRVQTCFFFDPNIS